MGWHPFAEVSINGHQLNAEADPHQKAEEDHPFRATLRRHQQRKRPYQASATIKVRRRPSLSASGASRLAPINSPIKVAEAKAALVGDAEDARLSGVENALRQQARADIPGLEEIVELKEAAK